MSHVNAPTQPTLPFLARIPLVRVLVARTPAGPIVERRAARATPPVERRAPPKHDPVPRVRLALPLDLVTEEIPEKDAFVLTRMNGAAMALDELFSLCPMPPFEVLRVLDRWAERKLVVLA